MIKEHIEAWNENKFNFELLIARMIADLLTIEADEDCISREWVINVIKNYDFSYPEYMESFVAKLRDAIKEDLIEEVENAPSVVPKQVTGKLEDDVTARGTEDIGVKATEKSKLAPSRAEGEWVHLSGANYRCSNCDEYTKSSKPFEKPRGNYCPNCGAKMKGAEE